MESALGISETDACVLNHLFRSLFLSLTTVNAGEGVNLNCIGCRSVHFQIFLTAFSSPLFKTQNHPQKVKGPFRKSPPGLFLNLEEVGRLQTTSSSLGLNTCRRIIKTSNLNPLASHQGVIIPTRPLLAARSVFKPL